MDKLIPSFIKEYLVQQKIGDFAENLIAETSQTIQQVINQSSLSSQAQVVLKPIKRLQLSELKGQWNEIASTRNILGVDQTNKLIDIKPKDTFTMYITVSGKQSQKILKKDGIVFALNATGTKLQFQFGNDIKFNLFVLMYDLNAKCILFGGDNLKDIWIWQKGTYQLSNNLKDSLLKELQTQKFQVDGLKFAENQ